jgi:hypothetical protein
MQNLPGRLGAAPPLLDDQLRALDEIAPAT